MVTREIKSLTLISTMQGNPKLLNHGIKPGDLKSYDRTMVFKDLGFLSQSRHEQL